MPQTSFALLTNVGRAKEAAALANATTIEITHIAIGDGATVPSGGETALYNQVALKTISGHGTVVGSDNVAYFDCYLAAGDGPYTIREAGLYDVDGDLIAIAHYDPPFNKPVPSSGQTVEGTVRLEVAFSNIATVVIVVDPSIQVALQRLTVLPWIPIIELHRNDPPASPAPGDVYVVGPSPTGSWVGNSGNVAEFTIAGWAMMTPPPGHGVSTPDGKVYERVSGAYVEKIALDVQSGKWLYGDDTGNAGSLVVTLDPAPVAYVKGMRFSTKLAAAIPGWTVCNLNGLGNKSVVNIDGSELSKNQFPASAIVTLEYDGAKLQVVGNPGFVTSGGSRPSLPASTTIYVNGSTGSDTLYDGTSATISGSHGPFATIGKAFSTAWKYSPGPNTLTIEVANGTYSEALSTPTYAGPKVVVNGQSTAGVIVSAGASNAFLVQGPNDVSINNLTVMGGGGFVSANGGVLRTNNTASNAISGVVFSAVQVSIIFIGNHSYTGNCSQLWSSSYGSTLTFNSSGSTQTFTNAIVVSGVLAYAVLGGYIDVDATTPPTFVNPTYITGQRYSSQLNAVINTKGRGAAFFPGTSSGTTATGGQYA
jgi:hypothetical protein